MVSSLLENETVDLQALEMVCDHVKNSKGRASCIYQEVPLEFVCSPVLSHQKFLDVRTKSSKDLISSFHWFILILTQWFLSFLFHFCWAEVEGVQSAVVQATESWQLLLHNQGREFGVSTWRAGKERWEARWVVCFGFLSLPTSSFPFFFR